ncbi:unnamed protein product [Trichogramma brassicae]|uniref:Uncharacterized protein n=1 Tax=Trichogramma brassicae TaxID=86971 RepID=A0A6H5IFE4_9HYME|nr:unnamed protein product [Trichogramma brassicae]
MANFHPPIDPETVQAIEEMNDAKRGRPRVGVSAYVDKGWPSSRMYQWRGPHPNRLTSLHGRIESSVHSIAWRLHNLVVPHS